jgi:hypothetical protein
LIARIRRDFTHDDANEVIGWLDGLPADACGRQDPERVQAALVLAASGDLRRFVAGVRLLRIDWRDLLVAAELADGDWPQRLNAELPDERATH